MQKTNMRVTKYPFAADKSFQVRDALSGNNVSLNILGRGVQADVNKREP